jgi:phage shock protein PspC (stress-responsive transcriptional regulator)
LNFFATSFFIWRITELDYNQTNSIIMPAKLRKSRTDKMLAGVCGGFAEYLGWDATLVRIIFALILVSSFGTAVLAYFILAIVMPD